MPSRQPISRALRTILAIAAAAALSTGTVVAGESTGTVTKKPPRAQPSELSQSALGMEPDKPALSAGDEKPDVKRPDEFQFGDNTLHIDASRKKSLPPGVEENEQTVINKAPTEPVLQPSYFGLRLTAPIR